MLHVGRCLVFALLALGLAHLTPVTPADAGAKEVWNKVKKGATKAKDKVVEVFKGGAEKAKETGEKAVEETTKFFAKIGDSMKGLVNDTLLALVREFILRTAKAEKKLMEQRVADAIAKAEKLKKESASWLAKGKTWVEDKVTLISKGYNGLKGIAESSAWRTKIVRIFTLVAQRNFGDELRGLARDLAREISSWPRAAALEWPRRFPRAMCSSKDWPAVPFADPFPKSFTFTLTGSLGGYSPKIVGGGVNVNFGLIADLGKDKGKEYDIRGVFSFMIGVGGGKPGFDASLGLALSMSPYKVSGAAGPFVGISLAGNTPKVIGGGVSAQWSPGEKLNEWSPIPEVNISVTAGAPGIGAQVGGGYTFTFTKDKFYVD